MEGKIDPLLKMSSQLSGLSLEEILEQLPNGLTIWVDPGEVSYRIGETGQVTILYYNRARNDSTEVNPVPYPDSSNYVASPNEVSSNADQLSQLLNSFGERNDALNSLNNIMAANQFEQELASNLERLKFDSNPVLPYPPFNNFMQVLIFKLFQTLYYYYISSHCKLFRNLKSLFSFVHSRRSRMQTTC